MSTNSRPARLSVLKPLPALSPAPRPPRRDESAGVAGGGHSRARAGIRQVQVQQDLQEREVSEQEQERQRRLVQLRGKMKEYADKWLNFKNANHLIREKLGKSNVVVLVDARPSAAFEEGHVEGAINVPACGAMGGASADASWGRLDAAAATAAVDAAASSLPQDKSTPILTYCEMGGEASACKKALERAGYTDVTNGGSKSALERWKAAMKPPTGNAPARASCDTSTISTKAELDRKQPLIVDIRKNSDVEDLEGWSQCFDELNELVQPSYTDCVQKFERKFGHSLKGMVRRWQQCKRVRNLKSILPWIQSPKQEQLTKFLALTNAVEGEYKSPESRGVISSRSNNKVHSELDENENDSEKDAHGETYFEPKPGPSGLRYVPWCGKFGDGIQHDVRFMTVNVRNNARYTCGPTGGSLEQQSQQTQHDDDLTCHYHPHLIRYYMNHVWNLPAPDIIISVTGGASAFELSTEAKEIIMKGMVDGTRSLDAWFVTGGTNAGIMKYVGEARAKYNPQAPLIGIVPLGIVCGGERLRGIDTLTVKEVNDDENLRTKKSLGTSTWRRFGHLQGMFSFLLE